MRHVQVTVPFLISFLFCAACGSSEPTTTTRSDQPAQAEAPVQPGQGEPPNSANQGQQLAQGFQQMAQGFQQMAQDAMGNNPSVAAVDFRELKKAFPDLRGWDKGESSGQAMKAPVPYSQAEITYTKGESRIKAQLVDSTMNQLVLAPFSMMVAAGFEKESDNGYEKASVINGNPAWEKWDKQSKSGDLNFLVAKRFLVQIDGQGLENPDVLKDLANKFDLSGLSSDK